MSDLPNFAAWSHENLAQFAVDAYRKMQQQQETIEQLQGDFKDAMVELRKLTSASLVNDQRLLAWTGVLTVWHADMRPSIKLSDDLVVANTTGHDLAHHLVWCHAWHLEVGSASSPVLTGVLAAHGIIALLCAQA